MRRVVRNGSQLEYIFNFLSLQHFNISSEFLFKLWIRDGRHSSVSSNKRLCFIRQHIGYDKKRILNMLALLRHDQGMNASSYSFITKMRSWSNIPIKLNPFLTQLFKRTYHISQQMRSDSNSSLLYEMCSIVYNFLIFTDEARYIILLLQQLIDFVPAFITKRRLTIFRIYISDLPASSQT